MLDAKLIALSSIVCLAMAIGIISPAATSADAIAAVQGLDSAEQAILFKEFRNVCASSEALDDETCDGPSTRDMCEMMPADLANFDSPIPCPAREGETFTFSQYLAATAAAEASAAAEAFGDDSVELNVHDALGLCLGLSSDRRRELGLPEGSQPSTSLAGLLEAGAATDGARALLVGKKTSDKDTARELGKKKKKKSWLHSHNPHRHNPHSHIQNSPCEEVGQTFDCSCSDTQTNSYASTMVFNQCQKGGGNMHGQMQVKYDKEEDGKVNGKTWGLGVFSVDENPKVMADEGSVCGRLKCAWQPWQGRKDECKCTCFKSGAIWKGGAGVKPFGSGASNKAYTTKCMGVCGVDCGTHGQSYRDAALVVHDVCQAYIGSTESVVGGGLKNKCGDEALHGTWSAIGVNRCD